jgi:DNA polymerase-3 subunit delta
MPALSPAALRAQLAAGDAGPLYLLIGADDVERTAVAQEFLSLVEEDLRAFNIERCYGAETSADAVIEAANVFPLMASRRVVLVSDAERVLSPKRESKAADEQAERLERFIAAPSPHATVVFICGSLDMRRRVSKALVKEAQVVNCGTIEDAAAAERWVKARAAQDRVPLDGAAVRALVERTGIDIGRLRSALERVGLYALGQKTVTAADVEAAVSPGPEAQADFGIARAIEQNDVQEALRQLRAATESGGSPFMILGQMRLAAERVVSARGPAAIDALLRTDLALKSSAGEPTALLERLVVELCGPRRRPAGVGPGAAQGRFTRRG